MSHTVMPRRGMPKGLIEEFRKINSVEFKEGMVIVFALSHSLYGFNPIGVGVHLGMIVFEDLSHFHNPERDPLHYVGFYPRSKNLLATPASVFSPVEGAIHIPDPFIKEGHTKDSRLNTLKYLFDKSKKPFILSDVTAQNLNKYTFIGNEGKLTNVVKEDDIFKYTTHDVNYTLMLGSNSKKCVNCQGFLMKIFNDQYEVVNSIKPQLFQEAFVKNDYFYGDKDKVYITDKTGFDEIRRMVQDARTTDKSAASNAKQKRIAAALLAQQLRYLSISEGKSKKKKNRSKKKSTKKRSFRKGASKKKSPKKRHSKKKKLNKRSKK